MWIMWDFIKEIWNRVVHNWVTSAIAIIAGAVIVMGWFGIIVTAKELLAVIGAIQALVLLFAKD